MAVVVLTQVACLPLPVTLQPKVASHSPLLKLVQLAGAVGAGGGVGDATGGDVGEVGTGGPHVMALHERP